MSGTVMVLALGAIVTAGLALPGSMIYEHWMVPVFEYGTQRLLSIGHFHAAAHPAWPYYAAWGIAALGTAVAWVMYVGPALAAPSALADALPRLYRFAVDKFRVDELYEAVVLNPVKSLARGLWKIVDVGIIDGLLVNGIPRAVAFSGSVVRLAQNGDVQRYAALMAVAAAAILFAVLGRATP
jgi:NADH-quinone oxidoreductase subunit L